MNAKEVTRYLSVSTYCNKYPSPRTPTNEKYSPLLCRTSAYTTFFLIVIAITHILVAGCHGRCCYDKFIPTGRRVCSSTLFVWCSKLFNGVRKNEQQMHILKQRQNCVSSWHGTYDRVSNIKIRTSQDSLIDTKGYWGDSGLRWGHKVVLLALLPYLMIYRTGLSRMRGKVAEANHSNN